MSGQVEWQPVLLGEEVPRYADFADELPSGVTLTSVSSTISVWSGNDPNPAASLGSSSVGPNAFGVNTVVTVFLSPQVLGVIYQLVIRAVTSFGTIINKTAIVAVRPTAT